MKRAIIGRFGASLLALLLLGLPTARAGSLGSFEGVAHGGGGYGGGGSDCLADPFLWDLGFHVFFYGFAYGGIGSMDRMGPADLALQDDFNFKEREWGEALIPIARVDADYQWLNGDVDAVSVRGEAGYGAFAVQGRFTRFSEEEPGDELDFAQWHVLYRMSFGSMLEVDLGMGQFRLEGDDTLSELSFTVPVLLHYFPGIGLEYRPAWSDSLTEHSLGVLLGWKYGSLTAGYRWLRAGDDPEAEETLEGPYAGLSLHF